MTVKETGGPILLNTTSFTVPEPWLDAFLALIMHACATVSPDYANRYATTRAILLQQVGSSCESDNG